MYTFAARKLFKWKACEVQFSVTSGTLFASRKLPLRDILAAIAIFTNGTAQAKRCLLYSFTG